MAFCAKCGSEMEPGSTFCGSCGASAPGAETSAPPASAATPPPAAPAPPPPMAPAPPMAGAPAYGPPAAPMPMAGYAQPPKGGGGGKIALFSILGLLVVGIIVVLVGGFVWPGWFAGNNDAADVEKVVQNFYSAMQKNDAGAMVALLTPASRKELDSYAEDMGYDDGEELLSEYLDELFPENDLKITGLKLKSTVKGDTATVDTIGGTATYTDYYGDEVKESYDDDGDVFDSDGFDLKRTNGKWYLALEINI